MELKVKGSETEYFGTLQFTLVTMAGKEFKDTGR